MKFPLLLTTLLLAVSPVVADDSLHLQYETNLDMNALHAATSKFIKNEVQVHSMAFRIDFIDKTIQGIDLDEKQSLETYDFEIANDRLPFSGINDNVNGNSEFQWMIDLLPPFDHVGKG